MLARPSTFIRWALSGKYRSRSSALGRRNHSGCVITRAAELDAPIKGTSPPKLEGFGAGREALRPVDAAIADLWLETGGPKSELQSANTRFTFSSSSGIFA